MPHKNNHVVPELLLKQWEHPSSKQLVRFKRLPTGKLVVEPKSAGSVCYVEKLYWTYEQDLTPSVALEKDYFGATIETNAAPVLHRLLSGQIASLTLREREVWTRFLIAQWIRTPRSLHKFQAEATADLVRDISTLPEGVLTEKQRALSSNELIDQYLPKHAHNVSRKALPEVIESKVLNEVMNGSTWEVLFLRHRRLDILIGDNPILTDGAPKDDFLLGLPISPEAYFVCATVPRNIQSLKQRSTESLIKHFNKCIVKNANAEVYAMSKTNEPLVARHLRYSPPHSQPPSFI